MSANVKSEIDLSEKAENTYWDRYTDLPGIILNRDFGVCKKLE